MKLTEQALADSRERLTIIQQARDFDSLLQHPGWKAIYALHLEWVQQATAALRKATPANAAELTRRWQLASELIEQEADVINRTLRLAEEITGAITLEDALLMEKVNEQQSAGDPGRRDDSAGY